MEEENFEEQIDFNEVIDALLDPSTTFPARYLSRLSGVEALDLEQLAATWPQISPLRRQRLLEDMEALTDASFIVDFDEVFKLGLDDDSPPVRKTAIRGLWENDERSVALRMVELLETDPDPDVSAQAASGLGKFIYLGEIGTLDQATNERITQLLIKFISSDEPEIIRRRAVEAIGFSSHPRASDLIEAAYNRRTEDWLISALIAMGRSANHQWIPHIIENLSHEEPLIRLEAAQSAGLLNAQETVSHLLQMVDDPEEDVKMAAIWALSEVGGLDARAAIEGLIKNSRDDHLIEFLEDALENIDFNEVNIDFDMLDIFPEDEEELTEEDEWDEED